VLSAGKKRREEKYRGARQYNIAKYLSSLWGNPISRRCVGDILSEKRNYFQIKAL
jgi:hypothetical protein